MGLSFLVVPVVTMRLLAEERRSGTLEMLITLPVKDSDVVLGKYFGALGLVLLRRRRPDLAQRLEGAAKDAAGQLSGDPALRAEGKAKSIAGRLR